MPLTENNLLRRWVLLLTVLLLCRSEAHLLRRLHDELSGPHLRSVAHVIDDPAPAVFNVTPGGVMVMDTSTGYSGRNAAWAENPKNGTPWFRMKKTTAQGQTSHDHFGGLRAMGNFQSDMLIAHNVVRRNAGIPELRWNDELAVMATERVKKLSDDGCYIRHSPTSDRWSEAGFQYIGENLYKVINMVPTGVDIVDAWYAEIGDYSYGPVGATCTSQHCNGRRSPPCMLGHFTQVMWGATTDVGCGLAECAAQEQRTFVAVCNYGPGGNIVGHLPFAPKSALDVGVASEPCTPPSADIRLTYVPHSGAISLHHSGAISLMSSIPFVLVAVHAAAFP